jgi:hypothetical protein
MMISQAIRSLPALLRRRATILVAIALVAAGAISLKLWQYSAACTPSFDERYVYFPSASAPAKFRVYLIPGIHQSATDFLSDVVSESWVKGLTQMSADVAILNTPIPLPCWFRDDGESYRAAFLRELDAVMRDAEAVHGVPRRAIISGVSFGGLHAIVAFASRPGRFSGWQTLLTVTRIDVLSELKGAGPVQNFNAFSEINGLRGSTGFIAWGGADTRVDHRLDEALFAAIRSPKIVGVEYPGLGHEITLEGVADLLADAGRQAGG